MKYVVARKVVDNCVIHHNVIVMFVNRIKSSVNVVVCHSVGSRTSSLASTLAYLPCHHMLKSLTRQGFFFVRSIQPKIGTRHLLGSKGGQSDIITTPIECQQVLKIMQIPYPILSWCSHSKESDSLSGQGWWTLAPSFVSSSRHIWTFGLYSHIVSGQAYCLGKSWEVKTWYQSHDPPSINWSIIIKC